MSQQDRLAANALEKALLRSRLAVQTIVPRVERLKDWARVGRGPAKVLSQHIGPEVEATLDRINTTSQELEVELAEIAAAIDAAEQKLAEFSPRKKRCSGCGG